MNAVSRAEIEDRICIPPPIRVGLQKRRASEIDLTVDYSSVFEMIAMEKEKIVSPIAKKNSKSNIIFSGLA